MKRICEYCRNNDSCAYLKGKIKYKCPSVQDYEVGYEEAVDKACEWFSEHIIDYTCYNEMDGWNINHKEMHEDFRKAMEGES